MLADINPLQLTKSQIGKKSWGRTWGKKRFELEKSLLE